MVRRRKAPSRWNRALSRHNLGEGGFRGMTALYSAKETPRETTHKKRYAFFMGSDIAG